MTQQTAVEYLLKAFKGAYGDKVTNVISMQVDKAKQMEKEQIINAHLLGLIYPLEIEATKQAEQYYNETFKSEQ